VLSGASANRIDIRKVHFCLSESAYGGLFAAGKGNTVNGSVSVGLMLFPGSLQLERHIKSTVKQVEVDVGGAVQKGVWENAREKIYIPPCSSGFQVGLLHSNSSSIAANST